MGVFEHFPYTNFHDLNLDWILRIIKELDSEVNSFIEQNVLTYADPIDWDIATQYAKNTVVVDPVSGTAYMSIAAVPQGILLTNTSYWQPIFNYKQTVTTMKKQIAALDFEDGNAPEDVPIYTLFWYKNALYRAIRAISAGGSVVIGTNAEAVTVEDAIKAIKSNDSITRNSNADIEDTAGGDIKSTAENIIDTVSGDYTESGRDKSETFINITEKILDDKEIDVDGTLYFNTANPIKYGAPNAINEFFSEIPMVSNSNVPYKLLVAGSNLEKLKSSIVINVLDYGAKGDGETDDTAAFQTAIEAANTNDIIYAPGNYVYAIKGPININKKIIILWLGTLLHTNSTGACVQIDGLATNNANECNIYISNITQQNGLTTTPTNINTNGAIGVELIRTTSSIIHVNHITGFSYAGVLALCDGSITGEFQKNGGANNQIVLHNYITIGTCAHCGAGLYTKSKSSETDCFQANEIHIVWMLENYQDIHIDENSAEYCQSTSNLFIVTAIDNSAATNIGGAGIMCCSYFNKFIIAYMGCAAIFNTYSGFNQLEVSNTFQTEVSFTDVGCNNRLITSMPGTVDSNTYLGTPALPQTDTIAINSWIQNNYGVPIHVYVQVCATTTGTNGNVEVKIQTPDKKEFSILKMPIDGTIESTNPITLSFIIPTNWMYIINATNVSIVNSTILPS